MAYNRPTSAQHWANASCLLGKLQVRLLFKLFDYIIVLISIACEVKMYYCDIFFQVMFVPSVQTWVIVTRHHLGALSCPHYQLLIFQRVPWAPWCVLQQQMSPTSHGHHNMTVWKRRYANQLVNVRHSTYGGANIHVLFLFFLRKLYIISEN